MCDAEHAIQRQQVVEGMLSLTRQGQNVLLTMAYLAAEDETPERTKIIHELYQQIVREHGSDPLKRRRVHDHLSDLNLLGVLRLVERSGGRVNYNEYELDVSLESAIEVLESEFGNLDDLRGIAEHNGQI